MTMAIPHGGVFAISWNMTQIDGASGIDPSWLRVGASWQWRGAAMRLDGQQSVLPLPAPIEIHDIRENARAIAQRLSGALPRPAGVEDFAGPPAGGFTVTDGSASYRARIADTGLQTLVIFEGPMPPQGQTCWITHHRLAPCAARNPSQDVICFASDTLIATPQGARPVALLKVGDKIMTRDNGPQPVLWLGQSMLSGPALRRHPQLRPIRLRRGALEDGMPSDDLCVSPGHRIVVSGAQARALFGCEEVLVRASHLINYKTITQDPALHGICYRHLLLEEHQIIYANGVPTESFHPALAPTQTLREHKRALRQVCESWVTAPESYGPTARRCLNLAEAALLAA